MISSFRKVKTEKNKKNFTELHVIYDYLLIEFINLRFFILKGNYLLI